MCVCISVRRDSDAGEIIDHYRGVLWISEQLFLLGGQVVCGSQWPVQAGQRFLPSQVLLCRGLVSSFFVCVYLEGVWLMGVVNIH